MTTQYVYGPGGILQERQGSTWTAAYTYGSALLRRNAEVPLFDALGSERTVTDGSGSVTGSIAYEAFGQPVATSGSSASPYTFAATSGYRNDGDAGRDGRSGAEPARRSPRPPAIPTRGEPDGPTRHGRSPASSGHPVPRR